MKKIIVALSVILSSLPATGFGEETLDIGVVLGERHGYGAGKHYFNDGNFSSDKRPKLLTKLVNDQSTYQLTVSANRIFSLRSLTKNKSDLSLDFKLRHTAEKYLIDFFQIDPSHLILAVTEPHYGYEFIKFQRVGNRYKPTLFATINYVTGTKESDPDKAIEVGFDAKGDFIIKLSNQKVDRYTITEGQKHVLRNGEVFDLSIIQRFEGDLPAYLRVE